MAKNNVHIKEFFELEVGDYFVFADKQNDSFPIEYHGIVWMKINDESILSTAPWSRFDEPVYLGSTCDKVYLLPKGVKSPLE